MKTVPRWPMDTLRELKAGSWKLEAGSWKLEGSMIRPLGEGFLPASRSEATLFKPPA
ncbi:hypothetical protein FHR95_001847 [Halomonas fontilapidosi]|uniref:Uncharacterized protein n=1 Tax=Halomonas fontilapidosi TaxID=616675 RepID=A0A7W5DJZ7_9GAMM|nr:hypothetical protein [Halomonas fontilapidosi]MBB3184286.1 hypothetical protein [Halomonas fontilapidosi]